MEDENEYMKLPTEDKCVHKLWKARVVGYEQAAKLFNQIDDEKSPEWNKYVNLVKKFVTDSNAVAQEKGMEAALVFVENCFHAGKTTGEVMTGLVAKCIAAPKTKTKDLALQLTLLYVEIEKQEVVQEELTKGMDHKNPKIVSACVAALTTALKQFGNKVIMIKPLVKKIPALLTDRDKGVRDEGKALVVEMHRWIGAAIEPHIAPLQAVVQQELRDAFAANTGSAAPTRYLRSQQTKMEQVAASRQDVDGDEEEEGDTCDGDSPDIDPFELLDPVDILSKLPKDFYDKLEAKKWQERKEALDSVENLLKASPKLEGGDYADLVRALKKVISKDSNVNLVALAGRALSMLAAALRNKFQPYAVACISAILEKFKEKKTNVVTALREAIDAIYPSTNLEAILEDVTEAFNNKNPSVKSETALFLARAFSRTQPAALNKKMLKAYVGGLLKLLESADPTVRDAAAEALGTATKLVGEKNIAPHIGKLDNLKEAKVKEFYEKAVIQVKIAGPKKEVKAKPAAGKGDGKAGSAQPKAVKRPGTAPVKKAGGVAKAQNKTATARESELSQEEVDQIAEEIFSAEIVSGLQDGDWKTRLSAVRSFQQTVCGLGPTDAIAQVLLRTLNKKPGIKDTNMQVLRARIHALKYIAENFPLTSTSVDFVLPDVVTRLGEATVMLAAQDVLSVCAEAEACGLEHVVREALSYAMDGQKNPKVQVELFNWLSNAIKEFGMNMDIKPLMAHSKKAVLSTNPNVRTSAINFLGVLSMYTGPSLLSHFDSEKPALKQLIQAEMDKYANTNRPEPVRGVQKSASKSSMGDDTSEQNGNNMDEDEEPAPAPTAADTATRTDMALLITEPLLAEINDKNWKVRAEALEKLSNMISSAAPIKPSLGELPPALTARLLDSNLKLAQTAQQICESLAVAMGTKCKSHVRTFFPAFFQALGDSKQWIRAGAVSCLDTWCAQAGGAHVAMDGEMVLDALKMGSPTLRTELYQWLADNLPNLAPKSFPKDELTLCVPILYQCIEDRSADVRKKAADCVLPFMLHLGYEAMHKLMDKLKPGSKSTVLAVLDKARPNLPVQPLPSKAKKEDSKAVKSGGAQKKDADKKSSEKKGPAAPQGKPKQGVVKSASGSRKKEDDEFTPLLPNNNAKNQRIVDDQKLKVLKWNFVTPREEFFELLKDQMLGTGFQKQLVQNMFHNDFRYHLKALESLSEDLADNGLALQANLDLVLKWLTLRFFDTNPSVILKGLEYLSAVFSYLIDSDYTMAEYEANCFIPYLVLKVGDPKDSVRNGVKALFKQICVVYSVTKLFGYLMEGLKSKNARQRSECLECIGHLLETYGSGVMSPSLGVALRELARHIGDRDNGVRSAVLNCIAHAYFLEGEKIYKMIGQVSDKELSLLEERIKRAAKTRSAENRKSTLLPLSASGKPLARQSSDLEQEEEEMPTQQITVEAMTPNSNEEEEQEIRGPTTVTISAPAAPPVVPGPFFLDPEVLARLEAQKPRMVRTELPPMPDIAFLDEPVVIPNFRPLYNAHANMNTTMMSPPRLGTPQSFGGPPSAQSNLDDTVLIDLIHSISSPNLKTACRGLRMINGALTSGRGAAFRAYEERLVQAITQQIKQLRCGKHPVDEATDTYRGIATVLNAFYEVGCLGAAVSTGGVRGLLAELLPVLGATDQEGGDGALDKRDADRLTKVLNLVCVRVLEHSQHTALVCALISLLHETIGQQYPAYPRYQELLLKCFWKTLKVFPSWDTSTIDYDTILYKIHIFYKTYPASYWKKNSEVSDTPYRTVKTFVHTLVKIKGTSLTNHLTQIPDAHNTDLYVYLQRVFQQMKMTDKQPESAPPSQPSALMSAGESAAVTTHGTRLPRDVHEQLIHVLKCIANKEQNQDALSKLLDIRERHPEVDIWSYMQGSSFYFRSYVERGLAEAAERRRPGHGAASHGIAHAIHNMHHDNNNENENDDENDDENLHLVYMDRLRKLQARAGMPLSQPNFVRTPGSDGKNLADPAPTLNIDPQFELCAATQGAHYGGEGAVDVEKLRLKLQQIKNASRR